MRNTKYFELNIYDEEMKVSQESLDPKPNLYFANTLSQEQKKMQESPFFIRLSKAYRKWDHVMNMYNTVLTGLFKDFGEKGISKNYSPFEAGKFWQMFEYLDGLNFKEMDKQHPNSKEDFKAKRRNYQDDLMVKVLGNGFNSGGLLQTGWDLAINSALLYDIMPNKSAEGKGSVYLLENIVWDKDSLFYPSVTQDFQKRIVNEAFWQLAVKFYDMRHKDTFEDILIKSFSDLDPGYAMDNIMRLNQGGFGNLNSGSTPLVLGHSGYESFQGLSPRAIENYGKFMNQVLKGIKFTQDTEKLKPFLQLYVDAVNCIDEDGIEYFQEDERKDLLGLQYIDSFIKRTAKV